MAYSVSPGVTWSEIDLTTIVPALSTTEGGIVGEFDWGPVNQIMTVANEIELVRYFTAPPSPASAPNSNTYLTFFTAANFLAYGENLKVVRAANTQSTLNSTNGTLPLLIENKDKYEINYMNTQAANTYGMFAARYPGVKGNNLRVSLWSSANTVAFNQWEYAAQFNGAPGTSTYASRLGAANDEMHIIVVDNGGDFSNGLKGTVLEKFAYVSKAGDAKNDDGSSNFYINIINDKSEFIYILNHAQNVSTQAIETDRWGLSANVGVEYNATNLGLQPAYTANLRGGVSSSPSDSNLIAAYNLFKNTEEVDVSLIMTAAQSANVTKYAVENVAETRKDCVVFVSPRYSDVVDQPGQEATKAISYRNTFNSSTYTVMDSAWKRQFDKYNNVYRWIPLNGDIAGLCARTDFDRDPWFSPAGLNRGHIKNVTKLSWNPSKAERDELYKNAINPIVTFKGDGTVLYGDKTMSAKPSAFDRINVRRLFIVLEKSISRAAKYSLFEFNDEFTRAQFVALVEPFLRDVKGRRGIYDYRVVCDETNNTPEVIDRNEFIGDIYVKPARSINYIHLNFVAVRTGVAFSEVVGQF